ncbi:MAG TPA: NUDIX hydrolase [Microthrixaceae bacterium]|nr:NUDIX hydrolase [Microthrixaceae bacterium]HMT23471.1 NUDIX hydrolase [Microthrixaceae bacterium]
MNDGAWLGAGDAMLAPSVDTAAATRLVESAPGGDDAMERDRLIVADLIAHHPDIAVRTCRPGHLTGSAFVVDASGRHGLLMFHTKLQRWLQPGGHADGDTNLAAVAWREASEETGITGLRVLRDALDIDIHRVAPPAEDPHLHLDVRFLVVAPPGAALAGNHESRDLRWVEREALAAPEYGLDPGTMRLAHAAFAAFDRLNG